MATTSGDVDYSRIVNRDELPIGREVRGSLSGEGGRDRPSRFLLGATGRGLVGAAGGRFRGWVTGGTADARPAPTPSTAEDAPDPPSAARRRSRRLAYSTGLAALATAAWVGIVLASGPLTLHQVHGHHFNWSLVALGLAATGAFDVIVFNRGERTTMNFIEAPMIVGIVFLSPMQFLLAGVTGYVAAQVLRRRRPSRAFNNVANFLCGAAAAYVCYHLVIGAAPPTDPRGWLAGLVAATAAVLCTGAVVLVGQMINDSREVARQTLSSMAVHTVRSLPVSALLSVCAVALIWTNALAALLVAGLAVLGALSQRAQAGLRDQYGNLDRLYRSTLGLSRLEAFGAVVPAVLDEARKLFVSDSATLVLPTGPGAVLFTLDAGGHLGRQRCRQLPWLATQVYERGGPVRIIRGGGRADADAALVEMDARYAMAAPLSVGTNRLAVLIVAGSAGDVAFGGPQLDLFEALAANSGIAIRSTRLLTRLRREVKAREHEALHDSLTGLANRSLFNRWLHDALAQRSEGELVAVMLMDLDGFKEVNDTLGHHAGDAILEQVAARIAAAVGEDGLVARLGGDEFAFVLRNLPDLDGVVERGTAALDALTRPLDAAGLSLGLRASVGISVAPDHATDSSGLLKRADVAMYEAKASGGGIEVYDPTIDHHSARRLIVASELRRALESDAVEVWYQPKADMRTGGIVGAEALLRWTHPQHGPIPPDEFIPAAEQSGLIGPLTWRVLAVAIAQLQRWHNQGLHIGIAVNLSARSLLDAQLVRRVRQALDDVGVEPRWLTLELTESSIVADPARSSAIMRALTDIGVRLALDDFGTGYSSMTRLKALPIHEVKIDKSFVSGMSHDFGDAAIVRATIDLARSLGHTTVAEGVEDRATWEALVELGCDEAQGFHLAKAMPAPGFDSWLANRGPGRFTLLNGEGEAPSA